MKENITITLEKAKEWYQSGNATLKEVALQAFNKDELICTFKDITTLRKACEALGYSYTPVFAMTKSLATVSRASSAMFKLNIIRKALNLGYDLSLTENPKDYYVYYPYNPFVTEHSTYYRYAIKSGKTEVIGKIKSEGILYNVLDGITCSGSAVGLGRFYSYDGVCGADAGFGFLGCATKEIVQHFSKCFGMLITEAKYADMVDFEIIEDKYGGTK